MPASGLEAIFNQLTERHLNVFVCLQTERRHARMARRLGVSLPAVRSHIRTLCELTGCHSTDQLADWWAEHTVEYVEFIAERVRAPAEVLDFLHETGQGVMKTFIRN